MNLPRAPFGAHRLNQLRESRASFKIRRWFLWGSCAFLSAFFIVLGAYRSGINEGAAQGALEVDAAIAATRRAQTLWSPQTGYSALAGRPYLGVSLWGASTAFESLPLSAGLSVFITYSTRDQCRGAVESASTFFDQVFIDGKPQHGASASGAACGGMGQNALRLVKLELRMLESDVQAPTSFAPRTALTPTQRQLDDSRAANEAVGPKRR